MRSARNRSYKEITYQQLRSFCETALLGNFSAAARRLGLTHATVWMQVHALEKELGEELVERHGRGCRVTAAGALLVQLAGPAVTGITTLKRAFREARAQVPARLVVASFPRVVQEDLLDCVEVFARSYPETHLKLVEVYNER